MSKGRIKHLSDLFIPACAWLQACPTHTVTTERLLPLKSLPLITSSLGITVLGGMLAALLVGTFIIPAFYAIVQFIREPMKRKPGIAP